MATKKNVPEELDALDTTMTEDVRVETEDEAVTEKKTAKKATTRRTTKKKAETVTEETPCEEAETILDQPITAASVLEEAAVPFPSDEDGFGLEPDESMTCELPMDEEEPLLYETAVEIAPEPTPRAPHLGADVAAVDAPRRLRRNERALTGATREEMRQRELLALSTLRNAKSSGRVIFGKVIGVREFSRDDKTLVCASVKTDSGVSVLIPFNEFFDNQLIRDPERQSPRALAVRQRQILERTYGVDVPMKVLTFFKGDAEDAEEVTICSRREGLKAKRGAAFTGQRPMMIEGAYYDAQIVAVGYQSITVELGGVDTVLRKFELTNEPIMDLRNRYKAGDKIRLMLREIEIGGSGKNKTVSLKLDPIAYELEECKARSSMLPLGTFTRGIITRVYRKKDKGTINIYCWIPDYDVPARIRSMSANDFGREMVAGDEVRLKIIGYHKSGYVDAICRGAHGSGGLLFRR